jgi:flagellar biosynthetic protein FliR
MTVPLSSWIAWAPGFALVITRVGAAMVLLPGFGESAVPATIKIGITFCMTILLLPALQPTMPPIPDAGLDLALMIGAEVITGLWFGWLTRTIVLALPTAAQFIAYLMGMSSVLQPDAELGAQSTALSKLFELAAPAIILMSGLYILPLRALNGLFHLIPPGSLLPVADSTQLAVRAVGQAFSLALQLASPFVVAAIVWHITMGQISRVISRLQIYFVSIPGQLLGGLCLLALTANAILSAWQDSTEHFFANLPGSF